MFFDPFSSFGMENKVRQSNFEILRILAMAILVVQHAVYWQNFSFEPNFIMNKFFCYIVHCIRSVGTNIFILIAGYFLPTTTFKWKKLVLLILQLYLFFYGCRIVTIMLTKAPIDTYEFSSWFFPVLQNQWWFVSAYILVYILIPFLQKLVFQMNKEEFEFLICSQILIWSVFPTIFFPIIGQSTDFMNFYNRYTFMILLYLTGAYLRLYGFSVFKTAKKSLAVFVTTMAAIVFIVFLSVFLDIESTIRCWSTNSLFALILSISLFCFFKNLNIGHHPKINRIAATMLGVYLLHEGPFRHNIWHKLFVFVGHETDPFLFARILFAVVVVMLTGIIVELCRQPFEKYVSKFLDKITAKFFKNLV